MQENIKIVLMQTFHPGNIGAAARAMKNMGLSQLVLVNPVDFPSEEAVSRAGQATDVLEQAQVVTSLDEAIADCQLVIATSARDRSIRLPSLTSEQVGTEVVNESKQGKVAIVFGRERMGLHNEDIQKCHKQLNIDASPIYPVLNISQAIQIVCYEIFKAGQQQFEVKTESYPLNNELERFYQHLEDSLKQSGFIKPSHPGQAMAHLRAMFRRARPNVKELQILRGALSSLDKTNKNNYQ